MSSYIVRVLLPYIVAEVGGREVEISRALYIGFLALAFVSPIAGLICDIYGTRRIMTLSSIAIALLIPLYLHLRDPNTVIILRFVHAIFGTFALAAGLTIASEVTSEGGLGIGFLRFSQGLGIALGPIIASILFSINKYIPFYIASLLSLSMLSVLMLPKRNYSLYKYNYRRRLSEILRYVISVIRHRVILALIPIAYAEILCFSILVSYYTPYLVLELNFSEFEYGLFIFLESIAFSIGGYISEIVYRRYRFRSSILASILLLISYASLYLQTSHTMILAIVAIIGFVSAFIINPVYIEFSNIVKEDVRGFSINMLDSLINTSFILLLVLDPIVMILGSRASLLISSAIISICTTISFSIA
ncbi:MAG TPA: MFS transporter, partial [Ignisphaera sp.]|nr:MFS transporter [Ignisphaera sp.]